MAKTKGMFQLPRWFYSVSSILTRSSSTLAAGTYAIVIIHFWHPPRKYSSSFLSRKGCHQRFYCKSLIMFQEYVLSHPHISLVSLLPINHKRLENALVYTKPNMVHYRTSGSYEEYPTGLQGMVQSRYRSPIQIRLRAARKFSDVILSYSFRSESSRLVAWILKGKNPRYRRQEQENTGR